MATIPCDTCGKYTGAQGSWDTPITILCTTCSEKARENAPKPFPMFVNIISNESGNGIALRKVGNTYYRDGGQWSVNFRRYYDELIAVSEHEHLDGLKLVEITESEWRKCNRHYAPDLNDMSVPNDESDDMPY